MTDTKTMTLLTGATGDIGGTLVDLLNDNRQPFRAMCRRPEQIEQFQSRGIDAVHGDFADPNSVRAAME